jgi:aspartate carbamoyltransferase catalytic subunit
MSEQVKKNFDRKHLLGLRELEATEIEAILDTASSFKEVLSRPIKKVPSLRGRTIMNLFFEPSTRTRTSFELAAKRLSADILNINTSSSSLSKGESLKDMGETLNAMQPDILIIRHTSSGVPKLFTEYTDASIVSAGDGAHEHPTQALIDLFTAREALGGLEGKHVVIIGDIRYSRVARSNIYGFRKLGARVSAVGPDTLMPHGIERLGVDVYHRLREVLPQADAVILLRIQRERQDESNFPSLHEYSRFFGLSDEAIEFMQEKAIIMHPGPINRGVEISTAIADSAVLPERRTPGKPRTLILDQVTNGIAVRMAVLYLLMTHKGWEL